MSGPARVASLSVIGDFKAVLQTFQDDVQDALTSVNVVNQQILDWIEHDQLKFWLNQVRMAEEAINEAKGDLHRKKLTAFNEFSSHVHERKAIKKAEARRDYAEEKVNACRKWSVKARQVIEEFHAQGQFLANVVEQDIPKSMAFLESALRTLEEYVAIQGGSAGFLEGSSSTSTVELVEPPTPAAKTEPAPVPAADAPKPAEPKPIAPEGQVGADIDLAEVPNAPNPAPLPDSPE